MTKYYVYVETKKGEQMLKLATYNLTFAKELRDSIEYDNRYACVWIESRVEAWASVALKAHRDEQRNTNIIIN